PETVLTLAEEGAVAGMKDSSGNFSYHSRVLLTTRGLRDFRLFTGSEDMLLASLVMGGHGSICATANVAPRLLVDLVAFARAGDLGAARAAQFAVVDLEAALMSGGLPLGFKAALAALGVCGPWPAVPTQPLEPRLADAVSDALLRHGFLRAAV
ncbi:MAG TPA: dihydrodipicolinate synthase family protein, partial [Chloroflexota bacterium]